MPARTASVHRHLQTALRTFSFLLLLFLPSSASAAAAGSEPTIEDVIVTASSTDLLLFAAVKNCFTEDMVEGVRNAIPLTFRFDVALYKVRKGWFDANVVKHGISHTLNYDPIRQEYEVSFSEKAQPQVTKSLEQAEQLMTELSGLPVIRLNKLVSDMPYALYVKATLTETTFPLGIHSFIPLTSLWNFETDWRVIEFRY